MAKQSVWDGVIRALIISNLLSVALFLIRVVGSRTDRYWFMFWNLFLAWLPVLFAWLLLKQLRKQSWQEPKPLALTLLWLTFLPNSFYLITDLVHLHNTGEVGVLYDTVLLMSFILNGLIAGMLSLFWVHTELVRRRSREFSYLIIGGVLFATSFAIYLGRHLRWNSWDILASPAAILFDISDHIIHPLDHQGGFVTTAIFFALLSSFYYVVWSFGGVLQARRPRG